MSDGHGNRSRNCHCCGTQRVRVLVRVGTPTDPDYGVTVCPNCDGVDLGVTAGGERVHIIRRNR